MPFHLHLTPTSICIWLSDGSGLNYVSRAYAVLVAVIPCENDRLTASAHMRESARTSRSHITDDHVGMRLAGRFHFLGSHFRALLGSLHPTHHSVAVLQ